MARKPKLTPEITQAVVDAIRGGNFLNVAAAYAGIGESTLYEWMQKGSDGRRPYAEFAESVKRARAEVEVRATASLQRLILGGEVKKEITRTTIDPATGQVTGREVEREVTLPDSKAIGFFLERSFPDRWGRRQAIEVSGPGGEELTLGVHIDVTGIAGRVAGVARQLAEDNELLPPPPARMLPPGDGPGDVVDAEVVEEEGAG